MFIGSGEEADFKDGCLALRAATIAKFRANQSPGFSGQIPNGLGRQQLSTFRYMPELAEIFPWCLAATSPIYWFMEPTTT